MTVDDTQPPPVAAEPEAGALPREFESSFLARCTEQLVAATDALAGYSPAAGSVIQITSTFGQQTFDLAAPYAAPLVEKNIESSACAARPRPQPPSRARCRCSPRLVHPVSPAAGPTE